MSRVSLALGFAIAASALAAAQSQPVVDGATSIEDDYEVAFRAALARVAPSIVRIETVGGAQPVSADGQAGGFRQADGPTTGVLWSADGYILTSSFNFLRDPSVITVSLADERRFVAKLVARDQPSRLALLKIAAADLSVAPWAPLGELRPGQRVLVAGYGFGGREPALSVGVLSAVNRASAQAVQTDAKTSPGNYGGPLFDLDGRIIGVCVPLGAVEDEAAGVDWYDSGIGFAIHREHIERRIERLKRGETLERGLLGVFIEMRDRVVGEPPSSQPALPDDGVLLIQDTRGPAAIAGLRAGDVILAIDDLPTPRPIDFRRAMSRKAAGDEVDVRYRRDGAAIVVRVPLVTAAALRDAAATSQPATSDSTVATQPVAPPPAVP